MSIEVVGSYDPNENTVTPGGRGAEGYITRADSLLHYTIRFQNTGTNYAYNVVVLDSLDTDLVWSSISRITSSHPNALVPDYFQNKILAFYFNNIYLPDSVTNEEDSHGFVSFYIKQNPLLANGTQIKNKGAIYFDYNEPILTNEVLNTIQAPSSIGRLDNITIKVYPNPSPETLTIELNNELPSNSILSIQNIFGQTVRVQNVQLQEGKQLVILSTSEFAAGVYFVNLQNENGKYAVAKFVKE